MIAPASVFTIESTLSLPLDTYEYVFPSTVTAQTSPPSGRPEYVTLVFVALTTTVCAVEGFETDTDAVTGAAWSTRRTVSVVPPVGSDHV